MIYIPGRESEAVEACLKVLAQPGSVLLLPTETVYGLVCLWDDDAARDKIYRLKRRPANKLLAMFASDMQAAEESGAVITPLARRLFEKFTPGGITIICPAAAGGAVGVRVPDHPLVLALLRELKRPLANTSANLSGTPSALNYRDALATLDGAADLAIDGGALPENSVASTVVDATGANPVILRKGAIPDAEIMTE